MCDDGSMTDHGCNVFSSLCRMRHEFEESLRTLLQMGYQIAATPGTANYYQQRGLGPVVTLFKPTDTKEDDEKSTLLFWIQQKKVDLVINIPEGSNRGEEVTSGYLMRRAAVDFGISLITNVK